MSTLMAIPRELREEIIRYLTLPGTVYTSSAQANTQALHQPGSRKSEETYIDTRIFLPSRPPANILSTCKQLRQESLEHHAHWLNSSAAFEIADSNVGPANSTKIAERSGTEFDEAAERAGDDGVTLRFTLEVQRGLRGPFGFFVPVRKELSPRFSALLPLMKSARRLKIVVIPGFDWWSGGPKTSPLEQWRQRKALLKRANAYQVGHTEQPTQAEAIETGEPSQPRLDAVSVAIGKLLDQLPAVEELKLDVLIATGDLFRWDLPDAKWENIQPWLDSPISMSGGGQLIKVSRTLMTIWHKPETEVASCQPFYVQKENRSDISGNKWLVKREAGLRAPLFEHIAHLTVYELPEISVNEVFERIDP
ncbi:hypothetical protein C7974DRAFT_408200 [Boeremia exigua]|uniref:uncharacterized protein n=1 Tax=Boeremia exigua TaxID=749465 RepID=UPI001E8EB0A6|nr:uncharacterized protein C7974DRAFT_408200 [Boeremia exigua]KAH6644528.1 hypothetical protein C7974DRAFT_408200 [Boeremia exigua]